MAAPGVYDKMIAEIRLDLGQPESHAPDDDLICQKIADAAQVLRLQQVNSPVQWSGYYWDLRARANTARYAVAPVATEGEYLDFTKPTRIHTIDPSDTTHVNRQIRICERQNVGEHYDGPELALEGADKHSAAVIIVEWQDEVPYLEIVPTPREAATYRVWYESGAIADPQATSQRVPVMPEFFRYLRYKADLLLLPYAEWKQIPADKWERRRVELATGFAPAAVDFEQAWQKFIRASRQAGSGRPNTYADWYEQDDLMDMAF